MLIILNIPSDSYAKFDWLIIIFCFLLLLALFVPNIGKVVNGSLRWIDLGLFNLQPSELAKFGLIIYVSGYCTKIKSNFHNFWLCETSNGCIIIFICNHFSTRLRFSGNYLLRNTIFIIFSWYIHRAILIISFSAFCFSIHCRKA